MIIAADPAGLKQVPFWRWLVAILLILALAGHAAGIAVFLFPSWAPKLGLGFRAIRDTISPSVWRLLYSLTFFLNLFLVQRYDDLAGNRPWSRLLVGVVLLIAAAFVNALAALLAAIFAVAAFYTAPLTLAGVLTRLWLGAIAAGIFFGATLGLLHRFLGAHTGRAPGMMKAHLWGGVISGILAGTQAMLVAELSESGARRLLYFVFLTGPTLAFAPHAILTGRAIRPAPASGVGGPPGTGQWLTRLVLAAFVFAALTAALILTLLRMT